jgi:hypothetical protein
VGETHGNQFTIVGLKSLSMAVWTAPDGLHARAFRWPYEEDAAQPDMLLVPYEPHEDASVSAVAFRDSVVVAFLSDKRLFTLAVDPWTSRVVSGPHQIAEVGRIHRRAIADRRAVDNGRIRPCVSDRDSDCA